MYINFEDLADNARIWIFQSKTKLQDSEEKKIENGLKDFISSWQAHGHDLLASHQIFHQRFIVVALDEASYQATGCSIDKLTHLMVKMETETGLSLMDRMQITYELEGEVLSLPMSKFKALIGSDFSENTMVFNNLIETKGDLFDKWNVELKDSWHKQMLA